MSKVELMPCPFCGGTEQLSVVGFGIERADETPEDRSHAVVCDECGGSGAERTPRSAAIAAWNRRASLPTAGDGKGGVE